MDHNLLTQKNRVLVFVITFWVIAIISATTLKPLENKGIWVIFATVCIGSKIKKRLVEKQARKYIRLIFLNGSCLKKNSTLH